MRTTLKRWILALGVAGCLAGGCTPEEQISGPFLNPPKRFFESRLVWPVEGAPVDVTAADLNGDGRPDLITSNRTTNSVSVLLGVAGGFAAATHLPVGEAPGEVAVADLDQNNTLDLAVTNETYSQVTLLPGNGNGTFGEARAANLISGSAPRSLTAVDLNRDGKLDLVTADAGSGTLTFLVGRGDLTFEDPVRSQGLGGPRQVRAADLDGDGAADLLVTELSAGLVSIWRNTGGAPEKAAELVTGKAPAVMAIRDLNGDNLADVAIANAEATYLSVFLNRGNFTFDSEIQVQLGKKPNRVAAADFNLDGNMDLAALVYISESEGSWGLAAICFGNGKGDFSAPAWYGTGGQGSGLAATDLNLDGAPDLAVSDLANALVAQINGRGDGTFESDLRLPAGSTPRCAVAADFNRDKITDLAVGNLDSRNITLLYGRADGGFDASPVFLALAGQPRAMAGGDLDGDGLTDLVVAQLGVRNLSVFRGLGTGAFGPMPAPLATPADQQALPEPRSLALADLNGDGKLDIVTGNSRGDVLAFLPGDGTGKFGAPQVFEAANYPLGLQLRDINRDGKLDAVFVSTRDPDSANDKAEPRVVRMFGSADTVFDPDSRERYATGGGPVDLALGSLTGNGILDAVTVHPMADAVYVLQGTADGRFLAGKKFLVGLRPAAVLLPDLNGDGMADIACAHNGGYVSVRLSRGEYRFDAPMYFQCGDDVQGMMIQDLNGDGFPELITFNRRTSDISVIRGRQVP
ncbi:MAG TPA: VCBS repeat-containing protein [Candidatus Hydrogenedentes bacterium]|nr:VCBS repeat-containing protein [Candidatus Hydrogenedentota bacterium]HOV61124.1 VCBS repeat-containing protein [Candidatus Hydrogenedentota bacterium]